MLITTTLELLSKASSKALTNLTFVGFSLVVAGCTLFSVANASPNSKSLPEAQTLAKAAYSQVQAERKPYFIAAYSPRDRDITYCSESCVCLAQRLAPVFKTHGFDVRTIYLRNDKSSLGIKMRGAPEGIVGPSLYDFHYATAIQIDHAWYVLDPIILRDAHLELFSTWRTRIQSKVIFEIQR